MLSCVQLFVTLWTATHQAFLFVEFSGKKTGVGYHSYSRGFSRPKDQTHISWVSCIDRRILYYCATSICPYVNAVVNYYQSCLN